MGRCYLSNYFTTETGIEWIRRAVEEEDDTEAMILLANCYAGGRGVDADGKMAIKWLEKVLEREMSVEALACLASIYRNGAQGVAEDKGKAIEYYQKAVELGDTDSTYCLAYCYMTGEGVEIDYRKALELYEKAEADQDYEGLCSVGAEEYIEYCKQMIMGSKEQELLKLEEELKKIDDPKECYAKAWSFHHNGRYDLAVKCFTRSAEMGHSGSQYGLGYCYEFGHGVEQNFQKAWEWYTKSAEANYSEAIFKLGMCYENGFHHIRPDYEKALYYYKLEENGRYSSDVQLRYGILYYKGLGLEKDYAKAVELLEKHLDNGVFKEEALTILVECYEKGLGVEKNAEKVRKYQERLAKINDATGDEDEDEEIRLYHYSEKKGEEVYFDEELSSCKIDAEKVSEVEKVYKIKAPKKLQRMITMCNDDDENYVYGIEVNVVRILKLDEVLHPKEKMGVDYIAMGCVPVAECLNEDCIVYSMNEKKWIWRDNKDDGKEKIYMRVDDVLDILWNIEDERSR